MVASASAVSRNSRQRDARRIQHLCEQFSTASGWQLAFHAESQSERFEPVPDYPWERSLGSDQSPAGKLTLTDVGAGVPRMDLAVAVEFAELLATAIEQIQRSDDVSRTNVQSATTLLNVAGIANTTRPSRNTVSALLNAALNLTNFRRAAFFLLSDDKQVLRLRIESGTAAGAIPHFERQVVESRFDFAALASEGVCVSRKADSQAAAWLPDSVSTAWCQRLQSEAGPIGTLWFFDRRDRAVTDLEKRVIATIARQLATVLERILLDHESRQQLRLRRELDSVSIDQTFSSCRATDRFELSMRRRSHSELCGDLLEVVKLDDEHTLVALGDATGHSIPAALVVASVRGCLHTVLTDDDGNRDPARIMQRMNVAFSQIANPGFFMSTFLGILNERNGTLTYSNAGHPRPILLRQRTDFEELVSHGLVLGIYADVDYESSHVELSSGDLIVGFTDGVTECGSRGDDLFGAKGVRRVLASSDCERAETIANDIQREVEQHCERNDDDQSLFVLLAR